MKKRSTIITALSLAVVLALVIFVQPVRTLAIDALSVFRVRDVNAISITIEDIEQIAQSMQALEAVMASKEADARALSGYPDHPDASGLDSMFVPIDSPDDFTAFDLKLPRSLSSEDPQLLMLDTQTQSIVIDPGEINGILTTLGAQPLPDSIDGSEIIVQTPAVAIAQYSENILIAAQMPVFSGDTQALDVLKQSFLSTPMLTYNLRSQLADVDLTAGIVYVPVIEGFGRRTTVGNATGYIYTLSDLEALIGDIAGDMLPDGSQDGPQSLYENASVLIWARGGILYILAGNQQASELTRIAGSVR